MFNHDFIFKKQGFDWLPSWIDRSRLFNIAFEPAQGVVKLYFLSADEQTLYKVEGERVIEQHLAMQPGAAWSALEQRLGAAFDEREIQPDTMEGQNLYLFIEPAGLQSFMRFLSAFARANQLSNTELRRWIGLINNEPPPTLEAAWQTGSVALVRVSLDGSDTDKIYARPLLRDKPWQLDEKSHEFFSAVYGVSDAPLLDHLKHLWVSVDVQTGRLVLANQHHHLLHND